MAKKESDVQSSEDEEEQDDDEEYIAPPLTVPRSDEHCVHAHAEGYEIYS